MTPDRPATPLAAFARLPRSCRDRNIAHSTVDAFGRAHWLLTERPPEPRLEKPYDAVVVTVGDGPPYETHLSALRAAFPQLDALPDGGFVVADTRSRAREEHVQVFDALGRLSWTFRVGDGIEHLLTDEAGDLWVDYRTLAQCSTLQGGGVGHPAGSGPEGRSTMAGAPCPAT